MNKVDPNFSSTNWGYVVPATSIYHELPYVGWCGRTAEVRKYYKKYYIRAFSGSFLSLVQKNGQKKLDNSISFVYLYF